MLIVLRRPRPSPPTAARQHRKIPTNAHDLACRWIACSTGTRERVTPTGTQDAQGIARGIGR
ncbi:hypothetical protein E2C01_070132 [Portunus trituberculatus]|uniref:Uncharacterized protein n=1 Tax=Portunus trituberculatus TaxID=210409 RepID=A0A5B7I4C0_PORTR|nr:hypothetical protein [Portunus trituberculatus]